MVSSLDEAHARVAGARRYRVEGELARGGMGVVYRALDLARNRSVALKRALSDGPDPAARTGSSELLEREYRTLIALKHPRIIEVYDYGHDAAGPYYTMELLDGFDLRARCPLPWKEACSILRDVASSLALLHARRLLHRDVSPANIRVSAQGAKLFDFGTLVPFGRPENIAGTPACVPPEVLDGAELDQRVDLYALGATAYYALSGRLAYQARSFAQLQAVWAQHPPARPSTLAADIPPALDELVMSLLSLDPLSRPASAGEVIDRLSAIADLPRDEDERVVQSYLRNPNLVGRQEASTRLLLHLGRALSGAGSTVLVEGAVGHGKSVMLSELEREALIRGAVVLSVNGRSRNEPLGAVRVLAQQAARECASEDTAEGGETRGHASPSPQANAGEPSERELDELVEQFVAWADVRPLVLIVDDAHVADAHSLSVLSTLAKRAPRLRLLVALSADLDRAHEQVGLRAVRRIATRIHLVPLSSNDLDLLVRTVFGVVPGLKRLSAFLSLETSGNPMLCMDLLSELIERRTIRYAEGFWVLPQSFAVREIVVAQAAFVRRLLRVSESARALASCLSTRRTPSSLAFCGLLAQRELGLTIDQVEPLLDELVKERVLVSDGGQHAFAHRELQTMLYDQLEPARRARLHRVMAGELMALPGDDPSRLVEIACHLELAGDEAQAYRYRTAIVAVTEDLRALMHAFPDFMTLLKKYEQPGYSDAKLLIVTIPLLIAAMYSDPTLFDRYGEATVAQLEKRSGMQVMKRLRRYMPSVLALILGVVYGYFRWLFMKKSERPAQFAYPIAYFAVAAQLNAQSIFRLNRRLNDAIIARLEPMGSLPSTLAVRLVHDGMYAGRHLLSGRFKEGLGYLEGMQTNVHLVRDLDERGRQHFILGNGFWEGRIKLLRFGTASLTHAEALRASPLPFHWIMGESLRYAYHAGRGEVAAAEQVREVLDTLTARHGGAWVADLLTALEFSPYHIAGDVIGLKRCIEQLEQLVALHPDIALPLEIARAMYQGHRKRTDRSLGIYASIASQLEPFSNPLWSQAQAHWAECLNSEGRHHEALRRCQDALRHVGDDKDDFVGAYQQLEREQALALAGIGERDEAAVLLDGLLRRYGGEDQPLWVGLLHRDRARVAALSGDTAAFAFHMAQVSVRFRTTGNPALVAQMRTLADFGTENGVTAGDGSLSEHHITEELSLLRVTEQGSLDATGRAERVLEHVVRIAGARAGRLYDAHAGGARLVAQRGDDQWDAGLDAQVEALMLLSFDGGDTTIMTASATSANSATDRHELVTMYEPSAGGPSVKAVIALRDVARMRELTPERLEVLARLIQQGSSETLRERAHAY